MKLTNYAENKTEKKRQSEVTFFSDELFSEVRISEEIQNLPHIKETTEIKFMLFGEADFLIENQGVSLKTGEFLIIESFVVHSMVGSKDAVICTISLPTEGEKSARFLKPSSKGFLKISREETDVFSEISDLVPQMVLKKDELSSKALVKGAALILIGVLEEAGFIETDRENVPEIYDTDRIEQVKEYVHKSYGEEITITSAANILGLHPGYFCRLFKKETGKTFINYVNSYRISQARRKLLQRNSNITEIMYESGFSNYGYFNRVFKQYTGCSPTEYRRRASK